MGSSQRNKGKRGEREVATIFRLKGYTTHRGWQTRSGQTECDVEGTPWWIEVKRGKKVNIRAAMRQAKDDTDGRPPIVVWRDDREPWMVSLTLEQFLALTGTAKASVPVPLESWGDD